MRHGWGDTLLLMEFHALILQGRLIRLEPLADGHVPDLALAARDETIWQFMPYGAIVTPERMAAHVHDAITRRVSGTNYPFAVIHIPSGRAVGCTRYLDIQP